MNKRTHYISITPSYIYMYIYIYIRVRARSCMCTRTRVCAPRHACTDAAANTRRHMQPHTHAHMQPHTLTRICMHTCTSARTNTCTRPCTHTRPQTHGKLIKQILHICKPQTNNLPTAIFLLSNGSIAKSNTLQLFTNTGMSDSGRRPGFEI